MNFCLSDPGPMYYAGHGEHVTFTVDNGTAYAAVVGRHYTTYIPILVLAAHYPRPGYAPPGHYQYESQLAAELGADRCVALDNKSSLIEQMLKLY